MSCVTIALTASLHHTLILLGTAIQMQVEKGKNIHSLRVKVEMLQEQLYRLPLRHKTHSDAVSEYFQQFLHFTATYLIDHLYI